MAVVGDGRMSLCIFNLPLKIHTVAHSAVSYYSLSYNYLVVAVDVAEAQNMHF